MILSDTLSLVRGGWTIYLYILNTPINFWSFQLESDPDLPNQVRITDDQHTQ